MQSYESRKHASAAARALERGVAGTVAGRARRARRALRELAPSLPHRRSTAAAQAPTSL